VNLLQNKRAIMLAGAGLFFGATIFGWMQQMSERDRAGGHNQDQVSQPQLSTGQGIEQPQSTAVGTGALTSTGPDGIRTVPPVENVAQPVSRLPVVAAQARLHAGRSDPMSPASYNESTIGSRQSGGNADAYRQGGLLTVPPPPEAGVPESMLPAPPDARTYESRPKAKTVPLRESVRLVGLVDSKAIFMLPSDVAQAHGVMSTFTLGRGQDYAGITLQKVTDHSVTISDGKSVCIKELASIR
jgi:hypothetical protein